MACATLKRSLDWESALGGRSPKRRRCSHFCGGSPTHQSMAVASTSAGPSEPQKPRSAFPDVISNKLTPAYMAESIRAEVRNMQKQRHVEYVEKMENSDAGSSSGGENCDSPSRDSDKALFTFKQVGIICERMLREREVEIRQEYDNVLMAKLAEQYDAFVKFTYDQIHRNYSAAPSYLS